MTKLVGVLLAVVAIAAVMIVFIAAGMHGDSFNTRSTSDSPRVELNAAVQSPNNLGLFTAVDFLFERPRWLPGGVIQIIPTVGVNFGFIRPIASRYAIGRSFLVGTSMTFSDEELGFTTKNRYSYETGIQVYLSPMQYVEIIYGKRYGGDGLTTSFKTELRF